MKMNKPLVSVVIPVYNNRDQILKAIDSVVNQTYENFEIIIVNDGSSDGTKDILENISNDKISVIHQNNAGVSAARNKGVKCSSANWVAFLDADDEYEESFLEVMAKELIRYRDKNITIAGANYYIGDKSNVAIDERIETGIQDYFVLFGNQKSPNHTSTTIVNKNAFLKTGGFL